MLIGHDPLSFIPTYRNPQRCLRVEFMLMNFPLSKSLKRSSSRFDALRPSVVKETRHELLVFLLHWINLSIRMGSFPSQLIVRKNGDKTNMSYYRPISVLKDVVTFFVKKKKLLGYTSSGTNS